MNFGLTDTQQTLKNSVREFLAAECPSAVMRNLIEAGKPFDGALWSKIAAQGWTGLPFPEEYGGFGMTLVDLAVVLEEMGRALLPGPFLSTVLAGLLLERAAAEEQKQRYLLPISHGARKATMALLEASASWSPGDVQLAASARNGAHVLNGRKLFVADAGEAQLLICSARLEGAVALLAVSTDAPGLHVVHTPALDVTRRLYDVEFRGTPAELLTRGDAASHALEDVMDSAAAVLTAEMTGGMSRLLEMTTSYAKTRKQFGKPIGQFQAVQHLCADMLLMTESARSAAYYACWAVGEHMPEATEAVSIAKSYVSEAYRETANRAIQVHGGMGFLWENDAHLYYRRAKASELAFGDAAYHRERLARLVIDPKRTTAAAL